MTAVEPNPLLSEALRYYAERRTMGNPKGWAHVQRTLTAAIESGALSASRAQVDEAREVLRHLIEHEAAPAAEPPHVCHLECGGGKPCHLCAPSPAAEGAVKRVEALIAEEEAHRADLPAWEISVLVPVEAGDEIADRIYAAVADAAFETQPDDRENWDVFVSASKNPTYVMTHLLRRALAPVSHDADGGEWRA